MLKQYFYILFYLFYSFSFAQNEQLAFNYIENAEYQKAVTILEELYTSKKQLYLDQLLNCYQQLEQYDKALQLISEKNKQNKAPKLIIEEGYIYQLQKLQDKANKKYEEAIALINENPNYAYNLGNIFEKKVLLKWALKAYEKGQKENQNLNFDYQIALLQGQMGNLQGMIDKLLDYAYTKNDNTSLSLVQNYLSRFLQDEASESFSNDLKKTLLLRTQKTPDSYWNQFLSWYYVQQKDFGRAFTQEKAVYKRNPDNFNNIVSLSRMAIEDNQKETATTILQFVLENTSDKGLQLTAHQFLFKMRIEEAEEKNFQQLKTDMQLVLKQYDFNSYSLGIQLLLANFEAFNLNNPKEAISLLNTTLKLPLNLREKAEVKMKLADVMLYDEKFNQAILYYAQVEDNLKNDEVAHEASMRMAKANYYKGDFNWALQQVKELKKSSSLLIANDALELFLLLSDNSVEDSTHVALTTFSKADFKLYQNKKEEALTQFLLILEKNKGNAIEDDALFKIGEIYQQKKEYAKALQYFNKILVEQKESIYIDEALYFSAEIYRKFLNDNEKAKPLYEKVLFEHPDSIYFTDARKQYRILRGDTTS